MLSVKCRLCSSEASLISLFNGKSRGNRDHVRKLIDITTGIKFQKNDACKYICFLCTVQVYNFYIFKVRSRENEKKLQRATLSNVKVKSNKIDIPEVEDITLPNIEELKATLTPWLISKQKYCVTENNEDVNKNDEKTNTCKESSTQCDSVENLDKETQIQPSINEIFTQTNKIATKIVQIQCDLTKRNQKISKKLCKDTQTEATNSSQSVLIQCDLTKRNQKISKKLCKDTQTEATNSSQSVLIQCDLTKRNQKISKKLCKDTQTEANSSQSVLIQCNLIKRNQKISKKLCKDAQTETTNSSQSVLIQCELIKNNQETPKSDSRETDTQTELDSDYSVCENEFVKSDQKILEKIPDNTDQSVQCEIMKANRTATKSRGKEMELNGVSRSDILVPTDESGLLNSNQKIPRKACRDFTTQTESKCGNSQSRSLQSSYSCLRCREMDNKDNVKSALTTVKRELMSPSRSLTPVKSLSINPESTKTETMVSPMDNCLSPRSSNLMTVKNKIQNVIICKHCDKTLYSKNEYRLHKRSHQVCNFCKKRFSSIKKTKQHIESECKVQNLIKPQPVVPLIRLENLKDIQKKYASTLKILNELRDNKFSKEDVKKIFRLRSRSISNVDHVYNNTTSCKCCISVLRQISVGVDKAVQTNFLFDKELVKSPLEYFCENLLLKRNLKDDVDNNFVPFKKLKLSEKE